MSNKQISHSWEQEQVMQNIKDGFNVLITGSAGTGKSTILRELAKRIKGHLPIAASTGIAAVNVGGMTLHSWAGLGMGQDSAEKIAATLLERRNAPYRRVLKSKQLAIDEISMIGSDLFELTDQVFRVIRQKDEPFGGIQLILFGDFLQLPPVSRDNAAKFAFMSESWTGAKIRTHVLTQVFRQADAVFSAALNDVRVGNLSEKVRDLLKSRYQVEDLNPEFEAVVVHTHNADVDGINSKRLKTIKEEEKSFLAFDSGEPGPLSVLQKNCLAPQDLRLKVGAQVMLLRNLDPLAGLANGSIGVVTGFQKGELSLPIVKFANGKSRDIEAHEWQIKAGSDVLAERRQIPLRLAWAITAHKSQGMTLDKIKVHLAGVFECGQAYVALSRARTLEGLYIETTRRGCIRAHPDAVKFYADSARGELEPGACAGCGGDMTSPSHRCA